MLLKCVWWREFWFYNMIMILLTFTHISTTIRMKCTQDSLSCLFLIGINSPKAFKFWQMFLWQCQPYVRRVRLLVLINSGAAISAGFSSSVLFVKYILDVISFSHECSNTFHSVFISLLSFELFSAYIFKFNYLLINSENWHSGEYFLNTTPQQKLLEGMLWLSEY